MSDNRPIGMFDSGVGGISVLGAVRTLLPGEDVIYFGDTINAPYGTKSQEQVQNCVENVMHELISRNVKAVIIACNTATAAAASRIRSEYPLPIIGMEPALKPAHEMRHGGKILVMATPVTLSLDKFRHLMEKYGDGAIPLKCPGLMDLVEQLDFSGAEEYLRQELSGFDMTKVDSVVLGCTHYVFLRQILKNLLPENINIVEGNPGTARQLRRVLREGNMLSEKKCGSVTFMTSGKSESVLPIMESLYNMAMNMYTLSDF